MHPVDQRGRLARSAGMEMSNRFEDSRFRVNISGVRGIYLIHKGMTVVVF